MIAWILFVYQIQACNSYGCIKQWQYMGEFNTSTLCAEASKSLIAEKPIGNFKCIPSKQWNPAIERKAQEK